MHIVICFILLACMSPKGSAVLAMLLDKGHPLCPCLDNLAGFPVDASELTKKLYEDLGESFNKEGYGVGCNTHDKTTPQCRDGHCNSAVCDQSWCDRSWCFVDPTNCTFLNRRSERFQQRFYSYATCGDMDFYTRENRAAALEGRTLKAGFNSNSGGWVGAYSSTGEHFKGPIERWSGPIVEFVKAAAVRGRFNLSVTEPPQFLHDNSKEFFGSESAFDFCVYATSLGYLDFCVAQYTITNQRAASTSFMVLDSSPLYLIVEADTVEDGSLFHEFLESVSVIFQPFTSDTWAFIIFFVIPMFAIMFVYHEYGKRGSTFPDEEKVILIREDGRQELIEISIPWYRAFINSLYHVTLSVFQQAWAQPVVTFGAKLNLLGVSFFILTIIAAYTANLAALLTQKGQPNFIDNIDDALQQNYRFCAERKNMESIISAFSNIKEKMFVSDPVELGGDGKPGFNCGNCNSRQRVFEMIDRRKANQDESYCHAAIGPDEDLIVAHAAGKHCALMTVGTAIQYTLVGFPIYEKIAPSILSFFLKLKNEGILQAASAASRPTSTCHAKLKQVGEALSIENLLGIWIGSFIFATAGILVTCMTPYCKKYRPTRIKHLYKRDMNGNIVGVLDTEDDGEVLRLLLKEMVHKARHHEKQIADKNGVSKTAEILGKISV